MSAATAKRKDNGRTELDKNPKKMKASPTGKEMIEEKKIELFATPLSESAGKCVDPGKCNVQLHMRRMEVIGCNDPHHQLNFNDLESDIAIYLNHKFSLHKRAVEHKERRDRRRKHLLAKLAVHTRPSRRRTRALEYLRVIEEQERNDWFSRLTPEFEDRIEREIGVPAHRIKPLYKQWCSKILNNLNLLEPPVVEIVLRFLKPQ